MHLAFSLLHQTHRTYQRLLARKIYKYTFEFYHAKLLVLHIREKYAVPSQSHKNIYDCLYIYHFISEQQCIFATNPTPDHSHLLRTGSAPRVVLVHRSTEFPLQGTNLEALLSAHEMHSSEDVTSPNQPVGPWAAFGQLTWWEEPIQGIKLKAAWSSNPCNVYNKHTDSQH